MAALTSYTLTVTKTPIDIRQEESRNYSSKVGVEPTPDRAAFVIVNYSISCLEKDFF